MKTALVRNKPPRPAPQPNYRAVLSSMVGLLDTARRASARTVNAIMTATYWEMGRRIVEFEQAGERRAAYGDKVLARLSCDLTARLGRGFGVIQLRTMRQFHLVYPQIRQSLIDESGPQPARLEAPGKELARIGPPARGEGVIFGSGIRQSAIDESGDQRLLTVQHRTVGEGVVAVLRKIGRTFPLPWTHYVRLLRVRNPLARELYETEALRGGWSVRQLDRQIGTQFYERTALSRNKAAMLTKGQKHRPADILTAEEEIKDPFILEFLNLKDEYSERELENALVHHLESFLLELGGDWTFVGRQRRLRVDDTWYRVDLIFFHRGLRCLVIFDLKLEALTPADIGQMHLYCNYARTHWTRPEENPPVGMILCSSQGESLARYALDGLPNKMLVREYRTMLPKEQVLADEITRTRRLLEARFAAQSRRRNV